MPNNALIPLMAKGVNFGNSLSQGINIGNALTMGPYEQRLAAAKAKQLEAEAKALDQFGMNPYQAGNLAIDERRIALAEEEAKKGPAAPASFTEFQMAQTNPAYGDYLASRKPMTDQQSKAATYVDRMAEAHKIVTDQEGVIGKHPVQAMAQGVLGNYANPMLGADMQQTLQAQRNFINAALRRESGAVINPDEFTNARQQYFPQIGDGPEVIAQKRQNRLTVINGMSREAGPKYQAPEAYNPGASDAPPQTTPAAQPQAAPQMGADAGRARQLMDAAKRDVQAGLISAEEAQQLLEQAGFTEEKFRSLGITK